MTDYIDRSFEWHEAALNGNRGPIDADNPKAGFYRTKAQHNGGYVPVAYWYDSHDGTLRCHKNGRSVEDMAAREMWPHAARRPISAAAYWYRMDNGAWLDDDPAAAATAKGPDIDPEIDPVGSMRAEIDKARAGVDAYKAIDSDEQAAKAQTLRSALTTLSGKADKARKAAKEPHLEAGRAVDAQWNPLVNDAAAAANTIKRAIEAWEDVKRANARRAAQEAEKAAREAQEAGKPAPPPPAQNTPAPSTQIKGASGRAASVSVKPIVVSIDIDKCFVQFRDAPALAALFTILAQKAIDAGIPVPGATTEERSVIR